MAINIQFLAVLNDNLKGKSDMTQLSSVQGNQNC